MKFLLLITLLISTTVSYANETCSRVATINYQEVLVDAGSGKRGEGLRFYLQKDPESKSLLDEYQKRNKPSKWSASSSTAGSIMILLGLLQTDKSSLIGDRTTLLYGGGILVALSYLTNKTVQYSNEKFLQEAVNQYNKRNSPRIYFSPFKDNNDNSGVGIGIRQGF